MPWSRRCRSSAPWRRGRRPRGPHPGRRVGAADLTWGLDDAGPVDHRPGRRAGRLVHGGVGQRVRVAVALPGNPREAHRGEAADQFRGLRGERPQPGVLDLPAAAHLLHHELRVHPGLDLRGAEVGGGLQPGDQAPVLGHVVGGHPDRPGPLGEHLAGVRVADHRAVPGRAGVAPGPAVRLDQDHP